MRKEEVKKESTTEEGSPGWKQCAVPLIAVSEQQCGLLQQLLGSSDQDTELAEVSAEAQASKADGSSVHTLYTTQQRCRGGPQSTEGQRLPGNPGLPHL